MAKRAKDVADQGLDLLRERARPPLLVVLGSPRPTARLAAELGVVDTSCFQFDLYQAARLREELAEQKRADAIPTAADLWDLPTGYLSVVFDAPHGLERALKLDVIEQAYHVLRPRGTLLVRSPYRRDDFFPEALKKIFGRVHAWPLPDGAIYACRRGEERPRRRHEIVFQVRGPRGQSLRFISRPGVFSHGRLDDGTRALIDSMHIAPTDRVLDVGCGGGAVGVWAGLLAGPRGSVVFVDSNLRAVALAEMNARAAGLQNFQAVATSAVDGVDAGFDVALANPPYFAQFTIAERFAERSASLLKPGGRFYLVTKQPETVEPLVERHLGPVARTECRGYVVLSARSATC